MRLVLLCLQTLKNFGSSCFGNCTSLLSITLPNSVKSVGWGCFESCTSLKSCTYSNNSELTLLSGNCFKGCKALTEFTIPSNIIEIQQNVFEGDTNLIRVYGCENVEFLGGSTSTGWSVFAGCSKLIEVEGLSKVKIISSGCFASCTSLTTLHLNWEGLTEIKVNAFQNCSSLTNPNYVINGSTCTLGDDALTGSGLAKNVI
ncbi:MAG: leucine-rich repeat domain-containing protein [Clostridia bacterium]|nr:leucine-rich repeat domain-containing protein [Clostridia bacterium]